MKYYLISDNIDTQAGLRMAGVEGVVVHTQEEVEEALAHAVADKSVGLVLITSKLVAENRDLVFDYKLNRSKPLIVEMPDRHSGDNVADGIKRYIAEVVGIKI
ncbi:V-type ATP synthase subunit F [Ruminococcaceae bacterium OttesenSCG-928-I18]|nr:V-type ATP synthase subunit F [Ruminococcaceae bacterium OttesenSCG-928-I18]